MWKEMGPVERYEVVSMALTGKMPVKILCETFGMTRQTLNKAMEKVREASVAALAPRSPGRRSKPVEQEEVDTLTAAKTALEKELSQWKTKCEVTRTVLDLERKAARGEPLPGEGKKNRKRKKDKHRRKKA